MKLLSLVAILRAVFLLVPLTTLLGVPTLSPPATEQPDATP